MPGILLKKSRDGETLLAALERAGFSVSAPCGGKQRCGKCKITVLRGTVRDNPGGETITAPPSVEVLACRCTAVSDLELAPFNDNVYEGGSYERLRVGKADRGGSAGGSSGKVPGAFRAAAAVDIGTTTISVRLINLETGLELDTYSALNRQRVFGADVMSRIAAAREGKTPELFDVIRLQIKNILNGFIKKFNLSAIEQLFVSGNTVMLHLFANVDPSAMGEIPFTPVFVDSREYEGAKFDLPVNKIFLPPSISAFVGGDIVCGMAAIKLLDKQEMVFFIDIGTNGEMALFHRGRLLCASTAAGPALEGAEISCGTGSIRGAINKVEWNDGKLTWTLIGAEDNPPGSLPVGICGSGLIDAVAIMLEQEIIDETGAFNDDDMADFVIAGDISISRRDIRQYQLAKSAILSGIKILCKNAGIQLDDVKKVYVAGGLGFYLDQKSAVRTGLLPPEFIDRIEVCGNTSLRGAVEALIDPSFSSYCKHIQEKAESVELASDPAFMDAFAENMMF